MTSMPLPSAMAVCSAQEVADDCREVIEEIGFQRVFVSRGLRQPRQVSGPGGMTRVPFLVWSTSGRMRCRIRDNGHEEDVDFAPGTAILHAPGSYVRIRHQAASCFWRATFDNDLVLVGAERRPAPRGRRLATPLRAAVLAGALPQPGQGLIERLLDTPDDLAAARLAWVQALWWQLWQRLAQAQPESANDRFLALRAWLEEHAASAIGRDDAGRALGVHPQHVSRLCQQHGTTFTQLLLDLRLERARSLLADPAWQVGEVAHACGFADASYFIRRFRERIGSTPQRYRQ